MYERMLDKQNKPAFDDMAAYCGKGMELLSESMSGCQIHAALCRRLLFPMGINMAGQLPIERRKS